MEILPQELLGAIALELPITDLRRFRLLGRRYAVAGFPALVREFSFLNTLDTAHALQAFSQSPLFGSLGAVHHLNIVEGAWPEVDSQKQWAHCYHFLASKRRCSPVETRLAYQRYRQHIQQEASRTVETDIQLFRAVLAHFPGLKELTVSHMHAWLKRYMNHTHFRNLTESIWVTPTYESLMANTISRLLPILGMCPRLQRLNLDGLLNPRDLALGEYRYKSIRHLHVNAVLAGEGLENSIAEFLASFPGLTTLSVRTFPSAGFYDQRLPLQQMRWTDLQSCEIIGTCVPEDDLFVFIQRHHSLKCLALRDVRLTSGSWRSFFTRFRELKPRPEIVCKDIFPKRDEKGRFLDDEHSQRLLNRYLSVLGLSDV